MTYILQHNHLVLFLQYFILPCRVQVHSTYLKKMLLHVNSTYLKESPTIPSGFKRSALIVAHISY